MNDSFVSIVQDRNVPTQVAVRARVKEDLVSLFPQHIQNVITTDDSDYRFRLFLDKAYVSKIISDRVLDIDYDNFKNSVKQKWRKSAYMGIWQIMFQVQNKLYPGTVNKWWLNYQNR